MTGVADQDVAIARERGIPVYERIEMIPGFRGDTEDDTEEPVTAA